MRMPEVMANPLSRRRREHPTRYPRGAYVCMRSELGVYAKLGGTAEEITFVPLV